MKVLLTLTAAALLAGCGTIGSTACTDALKKYGTEVSTCAAASGADLSPCFGTVLPTPVPAQVELMKSKMSMP